MAKKKKQNVYMTVDEIRENGFQQEYSNLDGADISSVDDTKTYMTVDEIRKKYEEERWKEFSVDGDRGYHTVDEIRQAALDQGLVKPREIKEEKQEAQPLSPLEKAQQETKQYGNLAGMIKKTETETIPKITDEAIKNYNTSRIGREYLEKYDDSTSYADIQKDIAEVQGKREEDSSNKDAYDLALAMLKDYVNQNYDLNGTDLSQEAIKRRQEVYDYNQNEIDNINSKVEANEGDTGDLNLDDEETVSKYLNHDKDAVDFFMGYRSGRITQDAANQEKYITMRNYIENAANSDSVRDLRNEVENLRAQNAAYDRTQGQSDRYALQYGDEVKNEKTDLLAGTLHTRNNVPDNFDERVENGNDRFTDMGDISQPAIKRYGGENAVEDYNNMDAHTEMLTSEEKGIYSYLLRNEGEVSANAYLDSLKDVLQKRASETTQEYIDNASGAEKAVLLAASVPMNVYGTVTGFAEDAANIAAGKDIHPYSEAHSMYNTAQQTRSSVAEDIDEATNSWNVLGFSAGDAFQAAMSIPDFMLGALTPSYYAASMSMGAAQSTAKELWEEGATNEQIVAESVLSGAAEYVFERVSLDKIIDVSDKKSLIKTALAGMAIEGSEEANTEIANIISDVLVRGSQSEWNKMIRSYKDQGYSDSEAQAKAFGDMAKRVGYSAIGGAIGGAGGGAGVAVEKGAGLIQNKAERNKYIASVGADVTSAGNTQELIDQAYALDGDSKAVKNIQAQADKVSSLSEKQGAGNRFANWVNDKRTTKATGKLYASMQENNISRVESAEETEIKTALSKAYAEKIQADVNDKSVSKVVNALYKSEYTDEPLSLSESRIVNNNQKAKAALSEVQSNDDVIRSQINRAQRRATEDMASTAALTGTKEQATEKPAKIDIDDFNLSDDGKTYTADGGEQVDIKSISSVGANDIRVELSNGKTESVKALDLGSEDQAVVYQGIMDMQTRLGAPVTASFANAVVNEYNQAKATDANLNTIDFIYDAEEAVRKGYMNDNGGNYAVNLSESARQAFFDEGRKIAQEHTKAQQKSVQIRIKGNNSQRKGTVTYEDGIERSQLNERQQVGVDVVTHIAENTGIDVVFFRSTKDGKGRFSSNFITKNKLSENGQAPNGFWLGGKMYIDVNAGMNGEGLILFTAAHEIVHMIREGSPESFKALADFLVENYAKKGVDVNKLVLKEMTRSTNLNYDAAYEEVIAQSCESFLRDIHLSDKAEQLYKTDKGLATKIKNILNRILNAVKKWYGVAKPQSVEANYVSEMKDALSEAYDKYIAGIRAASENLRNMEKPADKGGVMYMSRDGGEDNSIKDFIRNVAPRLEKMEPVVRIERDSFKNKRKSDIAKEVETEFNKFGNKVDRKNFGVVLLEFKQINKALNYLDTDAEKVSLYAVPNVIKRGIIAESHLQHKERNVDSVTFAAPIEINGKRGNMGVVVQRVQGTNRYKTHRIIMPDGSVFVFENKKTETKTDSSLSDTERGISIRSVSSNSIPQTENEINREYSDIDTKFSIREEAPPKNTVTGYKVFRIKDGKLYPPMVANPGGADTPVGVWLNADVGERAPDSKTGRAQVKGKGGMSLSFRPGWHLGDLPRASQFDRKNPETGVKDMFPSDFVWAECDCAADVDYQDEAMSYGYTDNGKFRHAYAGLPRVPENGYYKYRTNPRPDTVPWIITGAIKVNRILSDAEVADILEKNGVTPPERQGGNKTLEELGLNNEHIKRQSRDSEYLDSVNSNDMKTAQDLVDEAAERAFANSAIRGEDGKLIKMYHGTNSDFTVFDIVKYGGKTGTAEGLGINLIDRKEGASGYGSRVIESYVNITKPAKTWEKTITRNDLVKLIRKSAETEAQRMVEEDEYGSVNEALKDTWISNYVNTYEYSNIEDVYKEVADTVLRYNTNDRDIVWEVVNGSGANYSNENWIKFYSEILKPTIGVDGFWTTWAAKDGKRANVVIAFDSSQVKSADPITYDDNGDVIPLSERFSVSKQDIRYQARDDDYIQAVDDGNMDTAQKMVDQAAKAAGYTPKMMYHGSPNFFTSFDKKRARYSGYYGKGFYFSDTENQAKVYGNTYKVYLKTENPLQFGKNNITREQVKSFLSAVSENEDYDLYNYGTEDIDKIVDIVYRNDALQVIQDINATAIGELGEAIALFNEVNGTDYDSVIVDTETVVYSPEQIKSAEPVTYDDDGKVIPLSQRFDSTKTDIRYQSRDDDLYFGVTDDAFDIDFGEADSVENLIAREFVTHHEDMGEVLQNVADIELTPKKVESIVNRVIRDNLGRLDEESRHTLSIELQMALERVNVDDPQTVSDNIIGAVRKAIEGSMVVDDKAVSDYNQLRDAFKGKKFYLTDEQINQLKEHNMTLDSYRRAMFGKVTIVKRENAKRSINGGYADAHELSLESLHDILESPDEVLGFRSWEWDEKGYDAPNIIKKAFETLRDRREQPITNVYSEEAIDERAVAIAAKITGAVVEAKYNSKQNPYVTKLVADLKQKRTEAVDKQKEKNRQKLAELKQKERERAEKRERELREKYREQRARGYENRKRTELRGKIRKLMNSFQSRLTKPHDGSYVPRELISQTVDILNAINMDTGRSTKLSEKIAALRTEYDKLANDERAHAVYDKVISDMFTSLYDSLGNTAIMDMTLEQLKQTYDTLRSLDHYIRESVKMTDTDEKRTAHQLGREMIAETKDVPKEHSGLLSGYIQTQLRADVMFNRLAGFKKNSTWSQMARMLNDGQLHMTQLQMEFSKIFADVLTDTKQLRTLSDTKHLVDIGLVDDDGNKVPITRGMMISLYMHLLNEDNRRHVENGGLTIPSMKEYYRGDLTKAFGSGQRSVRVGMIDFSQYAEGIKTVIEEQLTDYEIEWIEKAHEFFDGASREAINETTMKLYHFKKATVDNYFPIHTDSNYRAASFESITRDMSLENSGFMKERIKASNPILLEDIVDVINDQIQKVSKYCGLTIPIKNFQKVYGTTLAGFETSLQKEINKKFSGSRSNTSATKYIDNLITDLTSGRQTSDGPFAKFFSMARGNLAAATLTLNVRVAIAQAVSYPTAAAEIGWKPLMKALVRGGKNNRMISRADTDTIAEYSPLLWYRTQGYSNTEIGDIKELRKQRHQIEGKFKKALGWIEFFDGMTVGRLFYAAQYYVDEQFPTLKRGSEEYKQKVAEVYNDVIEKTQPNYTTMQRPDILRNPNALVKSMTMFMTQRLQNFNIVYDAVGTYNKYRKDLTAGKNGVTAQDLRQAKTKLRRAVVSQTVAAMTIVGMKLFADMLMHSMNAYRDDDDELTAESISLALLNNFADTIFGSVLFGSELYKILKAKISQERYYGISLSGVDSLTEGLEDFINEDMTTFDSVNTVAKSICQILGLPLSNAERIGKGMYYWIADSSNGRFMEAGVKRTNKQNIHLAEMRYTSGDTAGAQKLLTAMMEQNKSEGKTDKEARTWLRRQLTSTYKPRYVQAVKDNNTDERTSIRQFLYQSGVYGSLTELDKALAKWADK